MNVHTKSLGVRDLREQLSANLALVREGATIVVTDHGKPIARIVPYEGRSRLEELIDSGFASLPKRTGPIRWEPPITPTPGPPISQILREEQDA